jgi:hypothetical protein
MVALEKRREWIVGYHGPDPSSITLAVPGGKVRVPQMNAGTIHWLDGQVRIDASGLVGEPEMDGGRLTAQGADHARAKGSE